MQAFQSGVALPAPFYPPSAKKSVESANRHPAAEDISIVV